MSRRSPFNPPGRVKYFTVTGLFAWFFIACSRRPIRPSPDQTSRRRREPGDLLRQTRSSGHLVALGKATEPLNDVVAALVEESRECIGELSRCA